LDDGPTRQQLAADFALGMPEDGTEAYVCGPADFVEAVLTAARALAWPETRLHRKYVAETLQRRARPSPASPLPLRALERSAA
jgi:ferredoxin-NADP reductase